MTQKEEEKKKKLAYSLETVANTYPQTYWGIGKKLISVNI